MTKPIEKILLVDDEPRLLSGLKRNLALHFSILTAQGGEAALNIIDQYSDIAVIITDMQMPGINGVELLARVKERAPHIRRMMLTGNADQDTAIAAVNDGAVLRFMRKPCDPDMLKEAIDYALADFRFSVDTQDTDQPAVTARNSFLSMMNHEMRTPLNHIIGLAQLIEIPDGDNSEQSRLWLTTLQESADVLQEKLERLLEYSRINSGEDTAPDHTFDVIEVLRDEVDNAKQRTQTNDVTVAFDTLRRHHDFHGREEEIRLAIREVLTNAIMFNKPGGHVGVTLRCSTDMIDVKISDTGKGIPQEKLQTVTGAFRQADESNTREHDGMGLGLSLACLIAQTHGGSLSITSQENKGTSVILRFAQPISTQQQAYA